MRYIAVLVILFLILEKDVDLTTLKKQVADLTYKKLIICRQVDLVEPVSHFLEAARENLSSSNIMQEEEMHKATNFYCVPLQVLDSSFI